MKKTLHDLANLVADKVLAKLDEKSGQFFEKINNEWMNTKEAAEYLRISENCLRVKISKGQIQAHGRLGKSLRFKKSKLEQLLNNPNQGVFND